MKYLNLFLKIVLLVYGIYNPIDIYCAATIKGQEKPLNPYSEELMAAIKANDIELVKKLLDSGINVDSVSKQGGYLSVLEWAIRDKKNEIAKLLLNRGANPNGLIASNERIVPPLENAFINNSEDLILLLLEKGANVNAIDKHGLSVLCNTIRRASLKLLQLLLAHGANIDSKCLGGRSLLSLLITQREGNDEDQKLKKIKLLLDNKINIDAADDAGYTPLMYAVINGYIKIVKILLESGADLNITNQNKLTALDIAKDNYNIPQDRALYSEIAFAFGANNELLSKYNHININIHYDDLQVYKEIIELLEAESIKRELARERREKIKKALSGINMPKDLANLIESYLPQERSEYEESLK